MQRKKARRLVTFVLLAAFLTMASGRAYAKEPDIMPLWDNATQVIASLSMSGTTAKCYGVVTGKAGTTSISGTMYLELLDPDDAPVRIRTWVLSGTPSATASGDVKVESGKTYMLTISATVTRNGVDEPVLVQKIEACD